MAKVQKQEFWKHAFKLFVMVSFPIHVWSIFQTFNNVGWVAERTRGWDALGYSAYAMMYALIESALIFLVLMPIFYVLTRTRSPEKALAVTALTYFVMVLLWIFRAIMINHSGDEFFLDSYIHDLADEGKWRKRYRYGAFLLAAGVLNLPVVVMPFLALHKDRLTAFVLEMESRVEILMYLLFGLDVLAILMVVVRNIQGAV